MLVHSHSGLRWLVLGLLIYAIYNAAVNKTSYEKRDKMVNLFAMISLHIQLLLGLILYYTSGNVSFDSGWMKNAVTRFYGMEHLLGMLLAIIVVTVGRKMAEKQEVVEHKNKKILVWYTIGL
ncbi:MAG: cytochrome B, partial [Flavobacteriales bacterium]|nr:cytochrome B [Flavobacteriales bacterium]